MMRRVLLALFAVVIAIAPLAALRAAPPAIATEAAILAKCVCHDCDGGACTAGTNCAFACALSGAAMMPSSGDTAPVLALDIAAPRAAPALAGLVWPPPLQPPTA